MRITGRFSRCVSVRTGWVLVCLLLSPIGCKNDEPPTEAQTKPARLRGPTPNIIFVLIDALRADRLGIYGNDRGLTPTLDALAAGGVVFERAIAPAPWTQPSIASLFCSRYPGVHKVLDKKHAFDSTHRGVKRVAVFNDTFLTLAESLQARGYVTAAFIANAQLHPDYGFAQGFDHYDNRFANTKTPANVVNEAVLTWLARREAVRPFFLYLHYMDVHGPYDAAEEYLGELLDGVEQVPNKRRLSSQEIKALNFLRHRPPYEDKGRHEQLAVYREYWVARYEAGVRQMDRHLGDFRSRLKDLGLWEDAYVIVTADHGEALCEHGTWAHGYSTHHSELHIPLILRWPNVLPAGRRVPPVVRLMDLMPTIEDQLKLPATPGLQGVSLVGYIAGTPPDKPPPAFAEGVCFNPEQWAIYRDDWKLIVTLATGRRELYDIAADPTEQNDLAPQNPQLAEELFRTIQEQAKRNMRLAADVKVRKVPLTPEQQQRLKALGYSH